MYLIQGPAEVEEYFKEVGYSIPVEDWGFDFRGVCGRALRDSDPGVYAVTVKYTYTPGDAFSERDPDVEFTPEAFVQIPLLPYLVFTSDDRMKKPDTLFSPGLAIATCEYESHARELVGRFGSGGVMKLDLGN